MKKETPYAFPRTEDGEPEPQNGMTLRDYFAAKAMQAYIGRTDMPNTQGSIKDVTTWSYEVADAMLKERVKP